MPRFAQFLAAGELGDGFDRFGLGLGFVEALAADGGVGQDAHQVRLHFEHAASGRLVLRTGRKQKSVRPAQRQTTREIT